MVIQKGHSYTLQYKAWASSPTKARPKVGMSGPPYEEYWSGHRDLGTEPQDLPGKFSMAKADDATAELAFHIGGAMASAKEPFEVCIDDIRLDDPQFKAAGPVTESGAPKVAVNQVGYLPGAIKIASVNEHGDRAGRVGAARRLRQAGRPRPDQGLRKGRRLRRSRPPRRLHRPSRRTGQGLQASRWGRRRAIPFDIGTGLYQKLKYDALAYFYHNRAASRSRCRSRASPSWRARRGTSRTRA